MAIKNNNLLFDDHTYEYDFNMNIEIYEEDEDGIK